MADRFEQLVGKDLEVISGFRSRAKQEELKRRGRPTAPFQLSTHTICPARGADLRVVGIFPSRNVKLHFGQAAFEEGLRWGGGSAVDQHGIPSDWNHVDLGPRRDTIAQEYRREKASTVK